MTFPSWKPPDRCGALWRICCGRSLIQGSDRRCVLEQPGHKQVVLEAGLRPVVLTVWHTHTIPFTLLKCFDASNQVGQNNIHTSLTLTFFHCPATMTFDLPDDWSKILKSRNRRWKSHTERTEKPWSSLWHVLWSRRQQAGCLQLVSSSSARPAGLLWMPRAYRHILRRIKSTAGVFTPQLSHVCMPSPAASFPLWLLWQLTPLFCSQLSEIFFSEKQGCCRNVGSVYLKQPCLFHLYWVVLILTPDVNPHF